MKTLWHRRTVALGAALAVAAQLGAGAQNAKLTVQVDKPGPKIGPLLYGLMTEEINYSYDGGLYGELIRNRMFRNDARTPAHWTAVGEGGASATLALDTNNPVNTTALTTSLRVEATGAAAGKRAGVSNDGYWGFPIRPNTRYRASFYARAEAPFAGPLTVDLESPDGATIYASGTVANVGATWKKYQLTLTTGNVPATPSARFVISTARPGTFWLNLVSLFPPTVNNRPNGFRPDLMKLLTGMNPSFLRLPGGNYLEGNTFPDRFDFKKTLGPLEQRVGHMSPWGYRSTDGMGLLEFLEWCEDLKIEPVLAVFAGYTLNGDHVAPGPALEPYVQDALDEIEYVTGGTNTKWGAIRATDGHPKPFPLTYVEIGNEDFFDKSGSYDGRYAQFYRAIKAKYPNLQIIATDKISSMKPDVLDEHYYRQAEEMELDSTHYDNYDRSGPKVFVGEWASQTRVLPWESAAFKNSPTPGLAQALGDAAWMIGMERNADVVVMQCYAPLFVNVNPGGRQWSLNLIGYDALNSYGSPSYYAQAMFGRNKGDVVLPVTLSVPAAARRPQGGIGVGTWATQAEYKDIQVVQGDKTLYASDFAGGVNGWKTLAGTWAAVDGALQQSSELTDTRATAGDPSWTDYSLRLKARKLSGKEGFLILVRYADNDNYLWWNVGGWNNTRSALEQTSNGAKQEIGKATDTRVETGRWYDVRVDVAGATVSCYLDGQLITRADTRNARTPRTLYATASRENRTGDIIVKVVNTMTTPQTTEVSLPGARGIGKTATAEVLTGDLDAVNTVQEPTHIAPITTTVQGVSETFTHTFPANSVTVLRIKAAK